MGRGLWGRLKGSQLGSPVLGFLHLSMGMGSLGIGKMAGNKGKGWLGGAWGRVGIVGFTRKAQSGALQ